MNETKPVGRMKKESRQSRISTPEYYAWQAMKQRCLRDSMPEYYNYGGRGITVCDRWLKFENFLEDMGSRPSKDYSLDRINNDGSYEPGNCRWATRSQQLANRRVTARLTYQGIIKTTKEWAEEYNLKLHTLEQRIRKGWPIEDALTAPVGSPHPLKLAPLRQIRDLINALREYANEENWAERGGHSDVWVHPTKGTHLAQSVLKTTGRAEIILSGLTALRGNYD